MPKEWSTLDKQKILLDKLASGWDIQRCCDFVGVSYKTYEYWKYRANGTNTMPAKEFSDEVERIRSKQAGEPVAAVPDFETFSRVYLGQRLFDHQLQWLDLLEGREPRSLHPQQTYIPGHHNLLLINTPPHHAKSQLFCVNYVAWRIIQDPNIRVLLVSASADRAKKNLEAIKNILDKDIIAFKDIKRDFAPAEGYNGNGAKWTQDVIIVNPDIRPRNMSGHPTVQALGIRKKIYGARADLIILDDCADLDNAHEYAKQIEWIQSIVGSRLEPGSGKLIIVGTRLAAQDLYSEIRKPEWYVTGESPYTYLSQPAVLEMTEDPRDWKTLWPRTNVEPAGLVKIEPDEQGLYPMWNGLALAEKRNQMSAEAWSRVYMQAQISQSTTFTQAEIDGCTNGGRLPGVIVPGFPGVRSEGMAGLYVVAGLDPAATNYTAMVVVGADLSTGRRYLLDVWNQHGALPAQTSAVMKEWTRRYGVNEWRIESNAYQASILQDEDLRTWMSSRGVRMTAHTTGKNKWDTQWGVATMASLFKGYEAGHNALELPSRRNHAGVQALVEQLVAWYPTPNMNRAPVQDCVMALWFTEIRCRELLDQQDVASHWDSGFISPREREEQVILNIDWFQASQGQITEQPAVDGPYISNSTRWWEQ
jgi:Terminase RNaseH-like domain